MLPGITGTAYQFLNIVLRRNGIYFVFTIINVHL
jgi:hypothetical protein